MSPNISPPITPEDLYSILHDLRLYKKSPGQMHNWIMRYADQFKWPLGDRNTKINLLEAFASFLEKNGYLDTDWRTEPPFAIDEFLKTR